MPKLQEWLAKAEQEETAQQEGRPAAVEQPVEHADKQQTQDFANRVMHHGLRLLRHPDGTLKSSMLTPNPYAVIARKSWRNLVDYCLTTGGDPQHTKSGLLQDTSWEGSQLLTDTDPLADSLHPFNSFLACVELPLTSPRK